MAPCRHCWLMLYPWHQHIIISIYYSHPLAASPATLATWGCRTELHSVRKECLAGVVGGADVEKSMQNVENACSNTNCAFSCFKSLEIIYYYSNCMAGLGRLCHQKGYATVICLKKLLLCPNAGCYIMHSSSQHCSSTTNYGLYSVLMNNFKVSPQWVFCVGMASCSDRIHLTAYLSMPASPIYTTALKAGDDTANIKCLKCRWWKAWRMIVLENWSFGFIMLLQSVCHKSTMKDNMSKHTTAEVICSPALSPQYTNVIMCSYQLLLKALLYSIYNLH